MNTRKLLREARLWLIAIPIVLWTLIPIYHIFLFAISSKDSAFSGALWPDKPTLRNFGTVFRQEHFYLHHFWNQIWNSLWIASSRSGSRSGDRKSTRLNSTHLGISYAVFCLKKTKRL